MNYSVFFRAYGEEADIREAAIQASRSQSRACTLRARGFFVAFGYTKDAHREAAAFYKRTGRIIKLLTVQDILDEEHVQKM